MSPAAMTLWVALGGALGSVMRFWIGRWAKGVAELAGFPWATLAINVSGSILLGWLAGRIGDRSSALYLALGVGVCGGYTTFSTFSLEAVEMMREGRLAAAGGYVGVSVVGGLAGCWLAFRGDG